MEELQSVIDNCESMRSNGDFEGALRAAIKNPVSSKDAKVKKAAAENVCAAMAGIGGVSKFVNACTEAQCDTLMKYTFKGMDIYRVDETTGNKKCARFLKWHEELTKKCGLGVIMRAMVDKKC